MVKTDEFAKNRFSGDMDKAAKIYQGVDKPLTAEDVAEAIRWSVTLPDHFNMDTMIIRPIAQAATYKVIRKSQRFLEIFNLAKNFPKRQGTAIPIANPTIKSVG